MTKVTFTLDEDTVRRIAVLAERQKRPKSAVVRDAIREFHYASGRMSELKKKEMLAALDRYAALPPERTQEEVDRELAEIRAARHGQSRLQSAG